MSLFSNMFRRSADPPEERNISISDPAAFPLFGVVPSLSGVNVNEVTALGNAAVQRCVAIIAGGIASLPLGAVHQEGGLTLPAQCLWLDNPVGPLTRFELVETTLMHMLLHGNAYLAHIRGGAGQLLGLNPIHPTAVQIDLDPQTNAKTYRVTLIDGSQRVFDDSNLTHVKWLSLDGIRGLSPITLARHGVFGTSIAADQSAAKMFKDGALMSAIATVDEAVSEEDAKAIADGLRRRAAGVSNAAEIAFINRNVKITPWSLSNEDAQWLQSREFQKSEVATWFGIPETLVGLSEKQSSWGTGITQMHRAMVTWTFSQWTARIEARLSLLLPDNETVRFDYKGLLAPDPEKEIALLCQMVAGGILTQNEARQRQNLPPIAGGDVLLTPKPPVPQQEPPA